MKKINSYNDLKALHLKISEKKDITKVFVGLATCGIAAGAKESMEAMKTEIEKLGIKNVELVRAGCMGSCYAEPTFEVASPGQPSVIYGNVDEDESLASDDQLFVTDCIGDRWRRKVDDRLKSHCLEF